MEEDKGVIVDVPDMDEREAMLKPEPVETEQAIEGPEPTSSRITLYTEVAEAKEDELNEAVEQLDQAIDHAVIEVVDKAVEDVTLKAEDAIAEIKNEVLKEVADVAMDVVDEVLERKNEVIDKATDKVLEALLDKAKEVGVKKSTLAVIIRYVMEAVEDTPIKGAEQKDYALRLIRSLVIELAEGDDEEYLLIALDSGSVADMIDLVVAASKGELNVNMVVEVASTSCLSCFVGLFTKRCKSRTK